MADDTASGVLVARWREGDQEAAAELFRRYADRLIALARSRLSARLARRTDPEDAVHSAYRSFFAHARQGRFEIHRGGDLWQLLLTITLRKVLHQVQRSTTKKRDIQREQHFGTEESWLGLHTPVLARTPSPMDALILTDHVEQLMSKLAPTERRVLELRLQGHNLEEIAAATETSQATVRRILDEVKQQLRRWYPADSDS